MGKLVGILLAIVIGGSLSYMKFSQQDDDSAEVREMAIAVMEDRLPTYETHEALYVQWLDAHHPAIFDRHYMMGGRRSGASFDEVAYWEDIFAAIADSAARDGYTNCEADIVAFTDYFIPEIKAMDD